MKLALVAVVVLVIVFILWLKLGRRSRRYGSRGGKRRQRQAYRPPPLVSHGAAEDSV